MDSLTTMRSDGHVAQRPLDAPLVHPDLAAARGTVFGLTIGALVWAAVGFGVWLFF